MTKPVLYDISPPLDGRIAVWPGDIPFKRETALDHASDDCVLSAIHTTLHVGAHADAFCHTIAGAASIDEMKLEPYLGPCQVIRARVARGHAITPADLPTPLDAPRILIATGTYPDPTRFNKDFAALSMELAYMLHETGVLLVGLDTPSVDRFASVDFPVHRHLARAGVASLEGLCLDSVPPGMYELIALPLRVAGGDAGPVRAVLRG